MAKLDVIIILARLAKEVKMIQYNMLDAKNNLSKICQMLKNGQEDYILIASNGKPFVKMTFFESTRKEPGHYKYKATKNVDWFNDDITNLFYGEEK